MLKDDGGSIFCHSECQHTGWDRTRPMCCFPACGWDRSEGVSVLSGGFPDGGLQVHRGQGRVSEVLREDAGQEACAPEQCER